MFWTHEALAAAEALRELLALRPDFEVNARKELGTWFFENSLVEHALEGLRKAGLKLAEDAA